MNFIVYVREGIKLKVNTGKSKMVFLKDGNRGLILLYLVG